MAYLQDDFDAHPADGVGADGGQLGEDGDATLADVVGGLLNGDLKGQGMTFGHTHALLGLGPLADGLRHLELV